MIVGVSIMSKFKINFFYLTEEKHEKNKTRYKEEIFYNYELILTSLEDVKNFWNARPCNVQHSKKELGTKEYFDEVEKKIAEKQGFSATTDDRFKILEMRVDLDLPGYEDEEDGEPTGIALPYIVTIEKASSKILAIRRNWRPEDEHKKKRLKL